jgi:hypothetical protein
MVDKGIIKKRAKAIGNTEESAEKADGPSPNPMTNLIIADLALRAGAALLRHSVEKGIVGSKLGKGKAGRIIKGRTMMQSLVGTAIARIATRSVPSAVIVGGGLLAKTLYDRRHRAKSETEGAMALQKQIERGSKS